MTRIDRIIDQLRQFPPLAHEDVHQLRHIATHVTEHNTEAGQVLLREQEPARTVYLLISGRATVSINGAAVAESGAGSILGEMGMLDHTESSATVTVTEPGVVLSVDWQGFESLLDSAAASRAISAGLAKRVRQLEGLDSSDGVPGSGPGR